MLQTTKILCEEENENFMEFIRKDCTISWSKHYFDYFIQLCRLNLKFPKLPNITRSLNFVRNKFKIIREAIISENDRQFLQTVILLFNKSLRTFTKIKMLLNLFHFYKSHSLRLFKMF
jgi:hypothetical protein